MASRGAIWDRMNTAVVPPTLIDVDGGCYVAGGGGSGSVIAYWLVVVVVVVVVVIYTVFEAAIVPLVWYY